MDERINESENKTSKIKAIDINLYKVIRSICKITYEKKIIKDNESSYETTFGSGFFIKLFINENELFCLMTNEHVIKEEMIKSHETIIVNYGFENELIQIKLDQSKRFIKSYPQKDDNIDITIIEILEDDNIKKEYFLLPNLNNINNINDMDIYIPQYPAKENISYSKGKIKSININNYEIIHNASTKPGSSGSPIFLKDTTEVIGVHKQGSIRKIDENYGTLMYKILQLLKKEKCKIKGRLMNNQKKIYKNGDYYIGQTLKDIPQGKGKIYYKNGNIKYEGDFVNGKYEGKGIYIWESNERYDGEWLKGKKNGKGIIYYKNGNIKYDGDFVNDKYEGKGKFYMENGEYYIGELSNDNENGKGIIYYSNGNVKYDGDFVNNKFEGNGKYYWEDGSFYDGQWKNNCMDGMGIEYYNNGKIKYKGDFVKGKYEGKGKFIDENGDYYDGELFNGKKHGKGKIYYKNDKIKYDGDFVNDKYEGKGKYIDENGNYYEGDWKNGKKHGKGKVYYQNGQVQYDGEFENGEPITKCMII